MSIEPVFTAHPTESTRRTILRKQQHIAQDLLDRLNPALMRVELDTLWARVRLEIASIWQTEEHPREGLTVADEREHVLFYLIEILYRVVPLFYEEIETALARAFDVPVESIEVPSILRFGSWVGGDMDGNADVHGKTIRETLHRHQQLIVSTYFNECGQLAETLEPERQPRDVSGALGRAHRRLQRAAAGRPGARRRRVTIACPTASSSARSASGSRRPTKGRPNAYQNPDELLADVELAADSLTQIAGGMRDTFWCGASSGACAPSASISRPWM